MSDLKLNGPAWQALYERFDELPVPQERVWEVQALLTRALRESAADKQRIAELEADLAIARDLIKSMKQEERWIPREEGLPTCLDFFVWLLIQRRGWRLGSDL